MPDSELLELSPFASETARRLADAVRTTVASRDACVVSLCGGSTPAPVYAALAGMQLPWDRVWWTFGDERCVPPEDPASNYRMVRSALFEPAGIPAEQVLRMTGEFDPATAAADYAARLGDLAHRLGHPGGRLVHDLALLGMGDDGHTASLFPGTAALAETEADVVANLVPKFGAWRLTLTYPALNRSRAVWFLVNDPRKRAVLDAVRAGGSGYPAEGVRPTSGVLRWVVGA